MDGERGHLESQGLLAAYCLGAVTVPEAEAVERHVRDCPRCREDLDTYEAAAAGLTGALDRMWSRVTSTLAGRREDLDCFLADVLGSEGERGDGALPIRVLVAADTDAARLVLASRLHTDDRFAVVAQAAVPSELLAEGVASLPDVIVLKLASSDRVWLEAVGELTAWAPRTRLVAVSGVNARHVAELVTTTAVVQSLTAGRPPGALITARTAAGPIRAPEQRSAATRDIEAPRSIIHEVMRQVGLPLGRPH
ncbi:MAG: hypothetical protein QOE35_461 [Actinomycetota bacterium]|jgi:hypothetical protein